MRSAVKYRAFTFDPLEIDRIEAAMVTSPERGASNSLHSQVGSDPSATFEMLTSPRAITRDQHNNRETGAPRPQSAGQSRQVTRTPSRLKTMQGGLPESIANDIANQGGDSGKRKKTIELSALDPSSRDDYMEFMVEHDFEFIHEANGLVMAVFQPGSKSIISKEDVRESSKMNAAASAAPIPTDSVYVQRVKRRSDVDKATLKQSRAKEQETKERARQIREAREALNVRPLQWLIRLIGEIYDQRLMAFSTEIQAVSHPDHRTGTGRDKQVKTQDVMNVTLESFSDFTYKFLTKKFGLESLVEQISKELIAAVSFYRGDVLDVELFGSFLAGDFSDADIMFFLFARCRVLPEVGRASADGQLTNPNSIPTLRIIPVTKIILARQPPTLISEFVRSMERARGGVDVIVEEMDSTKYLVMLLKAFRRFHSRLHMPPSFRAFDSEAGENRDPPGRSSTIFVADAPNNDAHQRTNEEENIPSPSFTFDDFQRRLEQLEAERQAVESDIAREMQVVHGGGNKSSALNVSQLRK